jgi:nucleoside-diphosphate-sugar epimerase
MRRETSKSMMRSHSGPIGTVLVTGIGGLIGGAFAAMLMRQGHKVIGMDREAPPGCRFPVITHDLPEPQRWHEVIVRHGVDSVVHAGGISGPMVLRDAPARICDINLGGLVGLLEAARIHQLRRIVWFSSINAYGEQRELSPAGEDTPLNATTVYGATKAGGEALINAYFAEHGVDAVSLRVASCYGPGRTTSCLIRTLVEDGLAGRVTPVRDEPGVTRQHVFIDDVIEGVYGALTATKLPQRAYNIGPGVAQALDEIVAEVRHAVPRAQVKVSPSAGLGWNTFKVGPLKIDAARRDLGFEPCTPIREGAARVLEWVKERAQGN